MKCIVLCAGFGKRLYPLTENKAKSLLEIQDGKPLINYIVEKVNRVKEIDEIHIITNNRFYNDFEKWSQDLNNPKKIILCNDKANDANERLGAVGDIMYAINMGNIDDDILIIAGDNLFDYSLRELVRYYHDKKAPVVASERIFDNEILKRTGIVEINENNKVISFKEKPAKPKSNIVAFATYIFPKETIPYLKAFLEEGNRTHSPGYFIEYLYKLTSTYSYFYNGKCYSIATPEALLEVKNIYDKKSK